MANDHANASVVESLKAVGLEEGRLEDASRESDAVHRRVEEGVDDRRRRDPHIPVSRLVQHPGHVQPRPLVVCYRVDQQCARVSNKLRIITK